MYFWHIIHQDRNELLFKFLEAQELSVSSSDWISQVRKDLSEIQLNLSDKEIFGMSKEIFGKNVRQKIEQNVVKYLKENSRSKTSQLEIKNISPAKYLTTSQLSTEEVQTLYKLRNRMIDLKENSKSYHMDNLWCRSCFLFPESQSHLLQCPPIVRKLSNLVDFKSIDYSMIFGKVENQIKITKVYTLALEARMDIIEEMKN